jgi:ZPR1 zinc-finger domain
MAETQPVNELAQYNFNISDQEVSRIVLELEQYMKQLPEDYIVPLEAAQNWLIIQLGYGDNDELEDALQGTLERFVRLLPQFEVQGEGDAAKMKLVPITSGDRRPRKLTYEINTTKDLFTVMVRGRETRIEIPDIEFEMGPPEGREIDTIYNYIGGAVFQLGQYIKHVDPSDDDFDKIYATMQMLNAMLDVESPFTIIAHDPIGEVAFKPSENVVVEYLEVKNEKLEAVIEEDSS